MKQRPIIFLDCDGVLNTHASFRRQRELKGKVPRRLIVYISEPELVERLRMFCEEFDAVVVVSSTWRKLNTRAQFISCLGDWLQPHIPRSGAWRTGNGRTGHRGEEIRQWFIDHPTYQDAPYVIFDDDRDFHPDQHFVHCNPEKGLSKANLNSARIKLHGQGWAPDLRAA